MYKSAYTTNTTNMEAGPTATATVGVPVYVIADREHGQVVVLSDPHDGTYQTVAEYFPGDMVKIPGFLPREVPAGKLLRS